MGYMKMNEHNRFMACLERIGYKRFTQLQKKVFNIVTRTRSSVIVVAPTGTGKTEAAIIPVMYLIRVQHLKPISAVYITPLRSLNRDITRRITKLAECFGLTVGLRHGDTPHSLRKALAQSPPHILVTTPETFNYIIVNDRMRNYLSNLQLVIIDEFREMMESKRGLLLFVIIYLLEELLLKRKLIKIALTATLRKEEEAKAILYGSRYAVNVMVVRDHSLKRMGIKVLIPRKAKLGLTGFISDSRLASRIAYLIKVFNEYRGVLVFTNTRSLAEKLGYLVNKVNEELGLKEIKVGVHHGSLARLHRLEVEEGFRKGVIKGLIATSSMELGIDIGHVDYVVQYMSPRQATRLLQRIGRSGHKLEGVSRGSIIVGDDLLQVVESIVLARRAISHDLEDERICRSPLDVLAYAIAVFAVALGCIEKYSLYSLLVDHPLYEDLDIDTYTKLLNYLEYARIIRVVGNRIVPTKKTKLYIYKTSMIPKTRDVPVIEISSGRQVGSLNEEYVVLSIREGDSLVLGGLPWKVVGYDPKDAKLFVEKQVSMKEIIIPHWEGENIPVEYSVARKVGSVIRRLKNDLPMRKFYTDYIELLSSIREKAEDMGDDKTIVVDYCDKLGVIIINVFGGTRANRFIKDLIRTVITNRYPFLKLRSYSTPYAVLLQLEDPLADKYVKDLLELVENTLINLDKYLDINTIHSIAESQGPLYWRILHVAQRLGAIDPDTSISSRNLLSGFINTIIGEEALKEVIYKDYDVDVVRKIASLLKRGVIKIIKRYSVEPSTFHNEVLGYIELPRGFSLEPFDEEAYKERILNRMLALICINCGFVEKGRVRDLIKRDNYRCPNCGLLTLAPIKSSGEREREIVIKARQRAKLSVDERRILEDLRKRAILLAEYGDLALKVLGGRGVGVSEAVRIISKLGGVSSDAVYKELYEAEKKFLKIKKYIDKSAN